ncbi:MAG: hypothetical protein ACK5Z2_06925 [Bacteroidota bacterium]|jgi:hypothetical protein
MKTLLAALFLTVASLAGAQTNPFQVGDNMMSFGIGVGSSFGFNLARQTPALSMQFEHALADLGPGFISVGGYLGYKGYRYTNNLSNGYYYKENWKYYIFGARTAWHLSEFDGVDLSKWDLYGGIMLSFNFARYKYEDNNQFLNYSDSSYGSSVGFSSFLGARYFLTDRIAVMGELGWGIAYLTGGISIKL